MTLLRCWPASRQALGRPPRSLSPAVGRALHQPAIDAGAAGVSATPLTGHCLNTPGYWSIASEDRGALPRHGNAHSCRLMEHSAPSCWRSHHATILPQLCAITSPSDARPLLSRPATAAETQRHRDRAARGSREGRSSAPVVAAVVDDKLQSSAGDRQHLAARHAGGVHQHARHRRPACARPQGAPRGPPSSSNRVESSRAAECTPYPGCGLAERAHPATKRSSRAPGPAPRPSALKCRKARLQPVWYSSVTVSTAAGGGGGGGAVAGGCAAWEGPCMHGAA